MKTKVLLILGFILTASFSYSQTVDEIVTKYLDAIGGKKNWDEVQSVKMTGNIDIGPNMKAPFTMYMKDKVKSRFELEFQGMKMITALNGDSGWKVVPFSGKTDPERMSPEEVKDQKEQADFTGELYNYKEKGSTVELVSKEDMEGTECYKLKVTKKSGDITYIYLDATTYLPLKETRKIKMEDKEVETASVPSNYKKVGNIIFPFSIEMRGGDDASQGQSMNIENVEINPVIAEELFKMPAMKSAVQPEGTSK